MDNIGYFLNINKPKGITSFDVIKHLRRVLSIKAIGHSGTLDPLACGVMQIGVGYATKLLDYLDSNKTYIATIKFGCTTLTLDSESEEIFIEEPKFSKEELLNIINQFIGKTLQTPPKFSAIKVNGQKLCDIARKNPETSLEIMDREIEIFSIKLLEFNASDYAKIEVECAKGTYIRSLIHDIGMKLGCGAYMTSLVRTKAGNFNIDYSDELNSDNYRQINPLDILDYPKYELNNEELTRILNGNYITCDEEFDNSTILLTKDNKLVSIANLSDNQIRPKKTFYK